MRQHVVRRCLQRLAAVVTVLLLLLPTIPTKAFAEVGTWDSYSVRVDSGYLALRSHPSYDDKNEIGQLYTGDVVHVIDATSNSTYWKVKADKYRSPGWVNKNYLYFLDNSIKGDYRVTVSKGYLALRTYPSYDSSNEIGELYSGDVVTLINRYSGKYWWVYSAKYNTCGYVNKDYLTPVTSAAMTYRNYQVSVSKGYLALRSAPSYNSSNEIGELYSGDVVTLMDSSNSQYWWVYAPKYDRCGYVNKDYLTGAAPSSPSVSPNASYGTYKVSVSKGYLALRTSPAYDSSNEIGELYSGDVVTVSDKTNSQYWWVYSPKLNAYGYVNKDYLVRR